MPKLTQFSQIGNSGNVCGRILENVDIFAFSGTRPIGQLTSCPLSFHPEKERIRKELVERGRKYTSLAGYHYKAYVKTTPLEAFKTDNSIDTMALRFRGTPAESKFRSR